MPKRVLLTGHAGFIGSHCVDYFLFNTDWEIIGLDSFRHKGTYTRLNDALENYKRKCYKLKGRKHIDALNQMNTRLKNYYHDLIAPIDQQLENQILERRFENGQVVEKPIDYIINMASDSAVERSTTDPVHCLRNNYELSINMLEFARKIKPKIFFQVSTDEVYGEAKPDQAHHEWDVIMPSNPYAASKAAQEAMAIAYWRTYDVPVVITNTMNNFGEWQDPEKFLPKIIQKVALDQEMPVYADLNDDGTTSIGARYYLHAKNHADAFVFLSQFSPAMYKDGAERPDRYNVCGDVELDNLELAQMIAKFMGKELKYKLVPSESARKGYDRRYALDDAKMKGLGWKMPITFEDSINQVVKWTLDNPHWAV